MWVASLVDDRIFLLPLVADTRPKREATNDDKLEQLNNKCIHEKPLYRVPYCLRSLPLELCARVLDHVQRVPLQGKSSAERSCPSHWTPQMSNPSIEGREQAYTVTMGISDRSSDAIPPQNAEQMPPM